MTDPSMPQPARDRRSRHSWWVFRTTLWLVIACRLVHHDLRGRLLDVGGSPSCVHDRPELVRMMSATRHERE